LQFSWLERVPRLATWLVDRLAGKPKTADDRREPKRSVKPEVFQLEPRFQPNDVLSILTAGPLFGSGLLAGGFTTPALALLRGWGGMRPPEPDAPAAVAAPRRTSTALSDAVFGGRLGTLSQTPPVGQGQPAIRSEPLVAAPSTTASPQSTTPREPLANPLGTDWLRAVDDVFEASASGHSLGRLPDSAGHDGGGGSRGGPAFDSPLFNASDPGGGGPDTANPSSSLPNLARTAGLGNTSTSTSAPSAPSAAVAGSFKPALGVQGGGDTGGNGTGTMPLPQAQASFGRIPLAFEPNVGQTDSSVSYLSHGPGFSFFMSGASAVIALPLTGQEAQNGPGQDVLKLDFVGGNSSATVTGEGQLPSTSNYFMGSDPSGWQQYVPNYSELVVHNIYPGIDLTFSGTNSRTLEYSFIVHPGGDPSAIQLNWEGVTGLATDEQGNLDLSTADGTIVENAPSVYQAGSGGVQQAVTVSTALNDNGTVGFSVGSYDTTKDLVIDPVLAFGSYIGGSGNDYAYGVAVDTSGDTIITGSTTSTNYPTTTGVMQGANAGGSDVFVTKLDEAGTGVVYSTYVGGTANDTGYAVAVDAAGNAYVGGSTYSSNFPLRNAYDSTFSSSFSMSIGPQYQSFFFKLSASGGQLISSTYLAGDYSSVNAIAVDQYEQIYVTGEAEVYSRLGWRPETFIMKFNSAASAQLYNEGLPATGTTGYGIAVDSAGNAFVTGSYNGAFVTEINPSGSTVYLTTFGGISTAQGNAIAVDINDNAFVTGSTSASSFPTTSGALQTTYGGGTDAFLTKLNSSGTIVYSSFLGGSGADQGNGIAVDGQGYITVVGSTTSSNFPTLNALQSTNGGGTDGFIARINPAGTTFAYSTYWGGNGTDSAQAVALDPYGDAFVAGYTNSTNFPISNAYQGSNAGGYDAFVSEIGLTPAAPVITGISPLSGSSSTITSDQNLTISGTSQASATISVSLAGIGVIGTTTANGSGAWSFNYSATTLPAGNYSITATATLSGMTSSPSQPFNIVIDTTTPTVTLSVPASTPSESAVVTVTATGNLAALPNGTAVAIDVDLLNDGGFSDPGDMNYASGTLVNGSATIALPGFSAVGTYPVRARVTDLAGNQGTSSTSNIVVTSVSAWVLSGAQELASDPMTGQAMQQLGNVTASQVLDLDQSPGTTQSDNPALVYNSDEVSVRPVIQASLASVNTSSLPSTVSAILTWYGTAGTTLTYSTTGDSPGETLTVAAEVPSAVSTTGRYNWTLEVLVPGQSPQYVSGTAFVVAEDSSSFGAGWTFSNTSQLYSIAASGSYPAGILRVYGTGGYRFYSGLSTYTSPAGDNGTLSVNGSGWEYTTPDGQTIQFNSNGEETSWTSADGHQVISYTYDGSNRLSTMTSIDGAVATFSYGTYTLLQKIQEVNNRVVTLAYTGTDLTSITNPDGGVHTIAYDGNNHVTIDTYVNLQHQWAYSSSGMLGTYTLGGSGSPTTTVVQPAASVGLLAAVGVAVQGSETDADGDRTSWQMDQQGRPLVQTAADGGVTTFTYSNGFLSSETDPLGRTTTYTLDSLGFTTQEELPDGSLITYQYQSAFHALTTYTDERGNTTTYAYDASGHLTSQTNALGQTTTYAYNAAGEQVAVTDHLGHTTSYAYDSDRRLTTTTDPLGNVTTYTYDANGNPSTTTDALGRVTTTLYDAMGRETGTINALGGRTTMTYLANGLELSQTDQLGNLTTYGYDGYNRGLETLQVVASGSAVPSDTAYFYDSAGRQTMVKDPMGSVTTMAYDPVGRPISTTDADGNTSLTQYDLAGEEIASRDALGRWTYYGYNSRGEQTTETNPLGQVTTTSYDAYGNSTALTDPLGHATTTLYDALNRQTSVTDALGHTTTTLYDAAGNTLSKTDADGNVTSYAYDAENRQTLSIGAYGTSLQQTTTTVYDKVGNTLTVTTPLGQTTSYQYDALNRQTVMIDALGHSTSSTYDVAGNLLTSIDYLGHVTSYSYDAQNRQAASTNPLNETTTVVYNALGATAASINASGEQTVDLYNAVGQSTGAEDPLKNVSQSVPNATGNVQISIDADGNVTTYIYDAQGRQIETIDPTGGVSTTIYDAAGNVLSKADANGDVTSYSYDSANRKIEEIDAYGTSVAVATTTIYDSNGNLLSQTIGQSSNSAYAHPSTTSYAYDSLNRQVEKIDGYGTSAASITTTVYDSNGNVLSTINPDGNVTSYAYDSDNRKIEEIDGYGSSVAVTTTMIYDTNGNLLSETTGQSTTVAYDHHSTTSYAYDTNNQQIAEIDAYGTSAQRTVTTVYDANGNVLSTIDGRGTITSYAYDSDNRKIAEIDAYGTGLQRMTTTVYDAQGNVIQTIDALGYATTFIYDGLNRQIAEQTPAGGTSTSVYDHDGNMIAQIDQLGHATSYSYDALNRKITETDALNEVTTYVYDAAGNQISLTDADGNTTTSVYDALNRLVKQTDPLGNNTTFAYDPAGQLTSSTDRDGRVRDVQYDALGRETGETWVTFGITTNVQTFTYDASGNQLTATDYNGAYTMSYDALNRMTSEQEPFGQTLTFAYDADGNQTTIHDSQGGTTTSAYDVLNRLTTREFGGPGQTTLRENLIYTARDQIATENRYTDLAATQFAGAVTYAYDSAMRVTGITDTYASGSVLASYVYNYDQASRLTSEVDDGVQTTYSYDADNELTGAGSTAYSYDSTGNRNSTGYVVGTGNELLSDGTYTYTYDNEGNLSTKRDGSDITTYTYDNRNRLIGVIETVGGTLQAQATYTYDVLGNRLEEDDYSGGVLTVTRFAYDGENVWADLTSGNALETRRLFLDGSDLLLARISAAGSAAWYDTDHLESVRDVVNYAGTMVLDQITYDAYGNKSTESSPSMGDRYGYTGREWDPKVQLQYNRARYFDPGIGAWTSEDPLGFKSGDVNLFRYLVDDPTKTTDPSGLAPESEKQPSGINPSEPPPAFSGKPGAAPTTLDYSREVGSTNPAFTKFRVAYVDPIQKPSGTAVISDPEGGDATLYATDQAQLQGFSAKDKKWAPLLGQGVYIDYRGKSAERIMWYQYFTADAYRLGMLWGPLPTASTVPDTGQRIETNCGIWYPDRVTNPPDVAGDSFVIDQPNGSAFIANAALHQYNAPNVLATVSFVTIAVYAPTKKIIGSLTWSIDTTVYNGNLVGRFTNFSLGEINKSSMIPYAVKYQLKRMGIN
jgi:RHS repeat-associated protein